eukprot:4601319-Pyramimonas_sp.AAC.1
MGNRWYPRRPRSMFVLNSSVKFQLGGARGPMRGFPPVAPRRTSPALARRKATNRPHQKRGKTHIH